MDIKNPANIQTPPSDGDKKATIDFSSEFNVRTMKEDLETLSKNKAPLPVTQSKLTEKQPLSTPLAPTKLTTTFIDSSRPSIAATSPRTAEGFGALPPKPTPTLPPPPKTAAQSQTAARFGAPPAGLPVFNQPPKPASTTAASPQTATPSRITEKFGTPLKKPEEIKPLPTPIIPIIKPAPLEKKAAPKLPSAPKKSAKTIIIVSILFILSVLTAGFYIWNKTASLTTENSASPTPSQSARPSPTPKKSSMEADNQRILRQGVNGEELADLLFNNFQTNPPAPGSFTEILTESNAGTKYLNWQEITEALGLNIAEKLKNLLSESNNLFIYAQANDPTSPFIKTSFRPIIIIEINENADPNALMASLKQLEPEMVVAFTRLANQPAPTNASFLDNIYRDIAIRYINFTDSSLTIDYAIINGKLIVATSKTSMYAAIDRLQNTVQ